MPDPGFGIYVHWPFCQSKCPYCDFNSHVVAQVDQPRWARAYAGQIAHYAALTPDATVTSIFFGGGTPSLMDPALVHGIVDGIRRAWRTANDLEITLEANPTSVEAGRFRGYRDADVNRISMGIQALNDPDLQRLGRLHSFAEARAAFTIARDMFDRVSFDLIYARQDQTVNDWRSELTEALSMAADHLSLYQLTIEDGTAFGDRHARGLLRGLPDEDRGADLYQITQDMMAAAGLPAYEISNHARPGAESRHNLTYWRGGDYVGIGPGAHGRLTLNGIRHTTEAISAPIPWLLSAERDDNPPLLPLTISETLEESLMMGLRLTEGIGIDAASLAPAIEQLRDEGWLHPASPLRLTPAGRPLLNAVLARLLVPVGS